MIQLNATILNPNSMYKEQKTLNNNTNLNSIINNQSQITINNNNNNNVNIANNNQIINRNNNPFWNDESNSGWTGTGVMSDRSSVYSIDDGDFDREASRKVNNQLREIESILYEQSPLNQLINSKSTNSTSQFSNSNYNNYNNNNNNSSNQNECNEWLEKFPHIRILGKQIVKDFDNNNNNNNNEILALKSSLQNLTNLSNFKNVHSNNLLNNLSNLTNNNNSKILSSSLLSSSSSSSINDDDNDTVINDQPALPIQHEEQTLTGKYFRRRENSELNNQLLNVFGTGMLIRNINDLKQQQQKNDINNESIDYSAFEEEIFEQEGIYEELLAYDNQEEEYLFEHNKRLNLNKRRRHGLPPITPKAAMKDLVANILFDHMWSQLIDWSADTIKTYARTIAENFRIYSDNNDTCKSPHPPISSQQKQLDSISPTNNTIILNDNLNNSNDDLITHSNTKSNGSNISPSYSSLIHNNTYVTNESTTPTVNNNNNNNVTKANIIQLKLFDSNIYPFQSYTPTNQLMTRDNSNLNSNNNNNNYSNNKNETYLSQNDTLGDLMTKDLLQIKQLNRNGSSTTTANNNILNKNLNTLNLLSTTISAATAAAAAAAAAATSSNSSAQSRVNSGNSRRQLQINYYRKRYSPIEMGINSISSGLMPVDKNIIIHGAGLSKLSSLNESNNNTNNNNRSANNSSQAYNNNNNHNNDENYETNEYNNNNNENNIYDNNNNQMDEINLISQNNAKLLNTNNNVIHTSHLNYFGFNNNNNNNSHLNNANFQPLPPIENSLTLKPLRISSANINNNSNLKQIKERKERPMTSTATRVTYIYFEKKFDFSNIKIFNK